MHLRESGAIRTPADIGETPTRCSTFGLKRRPGVFIADYLSPNMPKFSRLALAAFYLSDLQTNEEIMAYYTASREGLKVLVTPVQPEMHRKLKVFAAQSDRTLEQTCRFALEKFVDTVLDELPRSV